MKFRLFCLMLVLAGFGLIAQSGCHRGFYRRQADAEAHALLRQKTCDPRWDLPDVGIEISPESRMYDPFSLDHPPMPPDDPTAAQLMVRVDNKPGYPHWHANGDTSYVANPEWVSYLPLNEEGVVVLDLKSAVDLALLHSPEYQRQREELYLSALDVSLQRFGFDAQLFAGFNSFYETQGRLAPGGSSSTLETSLQGTRLQRLGITGSTMVIGLANNILWQFAGPNDQSANTLIDFSLIQPLLDGGGRQVIMESLTQAERNLLANVRQMERFRRGFYLLVVVGRNPGANLSARALNALGLPGNAVFNAGGFMGLLQAQQQIRIQEYNVKALRNVLNQLIEFQKAERISSLQVSQAQTQLYNGQNGLLDRQIAYKQTLDRFKETLGLPPDLPFEINDPILDQFELIDDVNDARQDEIDKLKLRVGDQLIKASELVRQKNRFLIDEDADSLDYGLKWTDELKQEIAKIKPLLQQIKPFVEKIGNEDAARVKKDFEKYKAIRAERIAELRELRQFIIGSAGTDRYSYAKDLLEDAGADAPYDPDSDVIESNVAVLERVAELEDQLKVLIDKNLKNVSADIDAVEKIVDELQQLAPTDGSDAKQARELYKKVQKDVLDALPQQLTELGSVSLDISLLQARVRTDSITLPKIDLTSEQAIKIAREFRRDWMNARADLVDQWRQVDIVANDLESTLDLVLTGSVGNFGDNPFAIRGETGQLRGGFQFDAPITKISERNQYREQLIQYARSRRQYYQYEDAVKLNLRNIIREAGLNRVQFEINRRSAKVAVRQVEESRLKLEDPGDVRSVGQINQLGATTTRDLTGAIQTLQNAQNSFLQTWVSQEVLRRNIDFDLGTMELTPDGQWVDPGEIDASISARTAARWGIDCDPLANEMGGGTILEQPLAPQEPAPSQLNEQVPDENTSSSAPAAIESKPAQDQSGRYLRSRFLSRRNKRTSINADQMAEPNQSTAGQTSQANLGTPKSESPTTAAAPTYRRLFGGIQFDGSDVNSDDNSATPAKIAAQASDSKKPDLDSKSTAADSKLPTRVSDLRPPFSPIR